MGLKIRFTRRPLTTMDLTKSLPSAMRAILGSARAEGQDIPLRAGESFRWPTSAEETVTVRSSFPDTLADAPLGAEVGEAVITCRGKEVGRVPLLCGRSVPPRLPSAADWLHILEKEG